MDASESLDATPAGIVGALYSLVSLMQAGEALCRAGDAEMDAATRRDALGPYEVGEGGPEVASLSALPPKVLRTLAVNLGTAIRELSAALEDAGGSRESRHECLGVARSRICGSLRIVRKLAATGLGGQLAAVFAELGCEG